MCNAPRSTRSNARVGCASPSRRRCSRTHRPTSPRSACRTPPPRCARTVASRSVRRARTRAARRRRRPGNGVSRCASAASRGIARRPSHPKDPRRSRPALQRSRARTARRSRSSRTCRSLRRTSERRRNGVSPWARSCPPRRRPLGHRRTPRCRSLPRGRPGAPTGLCWGHTCPRCTDRRRPAVRRSCPRSIACLLGSRGAADTARSRGPDRRWVCQGDRHRRWVRSGMWLPHSGPRCRDSRPRRSYRRYMFCLLDMLASTPRRYTTPCPLRSARLGTPDPAGTAAFSRKQARRRPRMPEVRIVPRGIPLPLSRHSWDSLPADNHSTTPPARGEPDRSADAASSGAPERRCFPPPGSVAVSPTRRVPVPG